MTFISICRCSRNSLAPSVDKTQHAPSRSGVMTVRDTWGGGRIWCPQILSLRNVFRSASLEAVWRLSSAPENQV